MDKSTYGDNLSQPLQTKNKQFKRAAALTVSLMFQRKLIFFFTTSITDEDGFFKITIPPVITNLKA